jgi:hypothetical protein
VIQVTEGISRVHMDAIYADPYILSVGHDHFPEVALYHETVQYYSAWIDGVFAGAFMTIKQSQFEVDVHAQLFKSSARQSRALGKELLELLYCDQDLNRVTAKIIDGRRSVINYCKKMGFVYEGRLREWCYCDTVATDLHILSMIRKDWSELWAAR